MSSLKEFHDKKTANKYTPGQDKIRHLLPEIAEAVELGVPIATVSQWLDDEHDISVSEHTVKAALERYIE